MRHTGAPYRCSLLNICVPSAPVSHHSALAFPSAVQERTVLPSEARQEAFPAIQLFSYGPVFHSPATYVPQHMQHMSRNMHASLDALLLPALDPETPPLSTSFSLSDTGPSSVIHVRARVEPLCWIIHRCADAMLRPLCAGAPPAPACERLLAQPGPHFLLVKPLSSPAHVLQASLQASLKPPPTSLHGCTD